MRSAGEAVRAGAGARADLVTLEGAALTVELDEGGVRALNAAASTPKRYETLSSLLLNESAGFVAAFNGSLAAQLAAVIAEREAAGELGTDEAAEADVTHMRYTHAKFQAPCAIFAGGGAVKLGRSRVTASRSSLLLGVVVVRNNIVRTSRATARSGWPSSTA